MPKTRDNQTSTEARAAPRPPMRAFRSSCPIARTLDLFGDKWTLVIMRDALFFDCRTFADFANCSEKIPTNLLAERLKRFLTADPTGDTWPDQPETAHSALAVRAGCSADGLGSGCCSSPPPTSPRCGRTGTVSTTGSARWALSSRSAKGCTFSARSLPRLCAPRTSSSVFAQHGTRCRA